MTVRLGTRQHEGRHEAGTVAESLHLVYKPKQKLVGSGVGFEASKSCSSKKHPPKSLAS